MEDLKEMEIELLLFLFKIILMVVSTVIVTTFSAVGVTVFYSFKVFYVVKNKKKKPLK